MNKEYVLNKLAQLKGPDYFNYKTVNNQESDRLHNLPDNQKNGLALFNTGNTNHVVNSNVYWHKGAWPVENKGMKPKNIDLNSVGALSGFNAELADKYPDYTKALIAWNASHGSSLAHAKGKAIVGNKNPFSKIDIKPDINLPNWNKYGF